MTTPELDFSDAAVDVPDLVAEEAIIAAQLRVVRDRYANLEFDPGHSVAGCLVVTVFEELHDEFLQLIEEGRYTEYGTEEEIWQEFERFCTAEKNELAMSLAKHHIRLFSGDGR